MLVEFAAIFWVKQIKMGPGTKGLVFLDSYWNPFVIIEWTSTVLACFQTENSWVLDAYNTALEVQTKST